MTDVGTWLRSIQLIAIAATAAVGLPVAQLTLGQSVWSATSIHYTG